MRSIQLRYWRWMRESAAWCARQAACEKNLGLAPLSLSGDRSHPAVITSSAVDADAKNASARAELTETTAKTVARAWGAVMTNLLGFDWIVPNICGSRSRHDVRISTGLNGFADAARAWCLLLAMASAIGIAGAA